MNRSIIRTSLLLGMLTPACGSPSGAPTVADPPKMDAGSMTAAPPDGDPGGAPQEPAPTYAELFDTYFAPGKPGHCATSGCHADPGHNVWLCGTTKESCYAGMVQVGLVDLEQPTHSSIADPKRSPLTWFNAAGGNMPFDAQGENPAARDRIAAWVAAGALDD